MKRILAFLILILLLAAMIPVQAQPVDGFSVGREAILSSLYEADIATLREAIDLGLVSCEELTAYYLERIRTYNEPYNCFITICDDALDVARQRDQAMAEGADRGILFGVPIVIKDNIDLVGYHTTNGHRKNDSQIADANAEVVDYLLAEGAVIIAKANMSTDAQSAWNSVSEAVGQTKNAYSTYISSAGSSGGSAVSVSLNFTVASLGTDTNSSLRLPAAYAGCVSLRATHGLVSLKGVTKLNSSRDIPGAITRTVYDQALMLDVLTGGAYGYTKNLNGNALQGLRIGILKELSYPVSSIPERNASNFDPEVVAAFEAALEELRVCGAELVEVSFSQIFNLSQATFNTNDNAKKDAFHDAFQRFLDRNEICAVVFPTYLTTPLRTGTDANGKYWSVWDQQLVNNCRVLSPSASLPEITVPIGLHSLGCGIGMEIAAPRNQEQLLLDIAYSYTTRYDHRQLPEGAPDAYAGANVGSLTQIIDGYKAFLDAQKPTEPPVEPTEPETQPAQPTQPSEQPTQPATKPANPKPVTPDGQLPVADEAPFSTWMVIFLVASALAIVIAGVLIYDKIAHGKKKK